MQEIKIVQGDLLYFKHHIHHKVELFVCMTDTLIHLGSKDKILELFKKVFAALEKGGRFVLTFQDLSSEQFGLDRLFPVRSDKIIIFTTFLEYEQETVKVHDIVYKKNKGRWDLYKSFYRKLRVSKNWVDYHLILVGFKHIESTHNNGIVTIITR